jgi:tetratricopeptide (TPR) repeat protein
VNTATLGAALFLAAGALGVARTQPPLAATVRTVKEHEDLYALPPPAELHAATLGWDAAAVDLLWSKLLVEYGIHWSEHREFRDVPQYADAILELEPTYAPLYKYIDTMLAYRPLRGTEEDVRRARAYLERGTRERPQDASVWLQYGQFAAFIGPGFFSDETERQAWRKAGATAMGHAVELGADADRALSAANVLTRAGETEAAIRYLERAYAFTQDPSMREIHDRIGRQLAAIEDRARRDEADTTLRVIHDRWRADLPFVSRDQYLLLGPRIDVARCAGPAGTDAPACAHDWVNALKSPGSSADSP